MSDEQFAPPDPYDPTPEVAAGWPPPPGTPPVPAPGGPGTPGPQPPSPWPPPPGASSWPPPPGVGWPVPGNPSWQPAGYPPSPARDRSRRVAWLVGSIAVVVTALIAGSIGYVIGDQHSRFTAAALGGSAGSSGCDNAPDPAATSPAAAALTARLLPMPSGASPLNLIKQGELSLDDFVQELYGASSKENQRLTALCFQAAVFREWQLPSGSIVAIWLVQFAGNDDARSYTLGTTQADSDSLGYPVKLTVPGVADGTDIATPSIDKDGNTRSHLLGDRGDVAMLIHVYVPAHLDNVFATQMLQQQNARL